MPKSTAQCKKIREQTKEMILKKSMLYFAKNGLAGARINDLAKHIGIGQGTLYAYFESKEALFEAIYERINYEEDIRELKLLASRPIPAKQKIHRLSVAVLRRLTEDDDAAGVVILNTQRFFEQDGDCSSSATTYQSALYEYTAKIIIQGQKENSVVTGTPLKLADYFWGVVYLYALKKLYTTKYEMISPADLDRTLLKEQD